ncbi:LPS-assembly protein LptD [Mangrovimicrobium sediminis]|uniref:LPS-assembly protein LptD n=1 Tax=Mangrovimicrobium sediminis TaxID=2562682 RepID=A0A4Z0LYW8_9GAMM|nr:LPS-assembly protein LptD [Haliea sp. SAOS-164]TGD72471.1 LPS-assembly protein LptD [Haliea sp. SAOS-164]
MTRRTVHFAARRTIKPLCLAVPLALAALSAAAQDSSETGASHPLDWVELHDVPEALRSQRCISCEGRYIDPLADADRQSSPDLSDIDARATRSELREGIAEFYGGVEVTQGYRQLSADSATLDREARSAELRGDIVLREPGLLLRGDLAHIESQSGEADISNSEFVLHEQHMHGTADLLERDENGVLHVHQGVITYCAPGENDWLMRAREMKLDVEEGLGTAYGARIDVAGVPLFYTPWLQFPLDDRRRTGFLWPEFGSDTQGGVDISAPFYFNLAPNYDLLYAPRFIEERGLSHEATARFLHPSVGMWQVGGAYMSNDERYKDDYPDETSHDRWLAIVRQNGLFNQRWRSRVDYSEASDVNYMKDLDSSSLDSRRRTALLQLASLDYLGDRWLANLDVQQFQSLADDISNDYKKLPQFTLSYRQDGTPFELDPILLAQYSNFDSDDNRVTGSRLYSEAGATYPMQWAYGFLTPTTKYRYLTYDLNDHPRYTDHNPETGSAMAKLDGGLFFDRQTRFGEKSMLQTLEPRLFYLYSQYKEQVDQPDFDSAELTFTYNQLFRETRFSGRDRIDDANQLSVGLTTRLIDEADGREKFNASIGQIYYFRDREVRLSPNDEPLDNSGSEVAGELGFFPNPSMSLRTSLVWDPNTDKMNSGNFIASYQPGGGRLFNLGYSYRRPLTTVNTTQPPTEQAHFSTYLPLARNWRVFGAINYSVEANTSVEDMFGVEYDSCCYRVRLLHLRYYDTDTTPGRNPDFDDPQLEREKSIQIQIVLKGMGGFGNRASGIMRDMIRGFTDSEY